jgi:hypothetical protein
MPSSCAYAIRATSASGIASCAALARLNRRARSRFSLVWRGLPFGLCQESRNLNAEACRNSGQVVERYVRLAAFHSAHVGPVHTDGVCKGFLRQACCRSESAHGTTELEAKRWHGPTVSRRLI